MKYSILEQYNSKFTNPQIYVKSPGRANIIGEHTDYNHGLVLPFAINQCIHMYIGKNNTKKLRLFANDLEEYQEIHLERLKFQTEGWTRYFVNALVACEYDGKSGIDISFGGDLPQGGGVSSSSALTCGFLSGINTMFQLGYGMDQLIDMASQAENGIGLNGGIMDQTAIIKGKKDHALKIDFLDHSIEEINLPNRGYTFYLFNSGQKHNLVETEYNIRRKQCEDALNILQVKIPNIETFRDITQKNIDLHLHDVTFKKRCQHVLDENQRVVEAAMLLKNEAYEDIGTLLLQSHQSLSSNYEVSTAEIDYLVDRSQEISNMLGSRIMGGGFGGCTINFVKGTLSNDALFQLKMDYERRTNLQLEVIEVKASDGIQVELL